MARACGRAWALLLALALAGCSGKGGNGELATPSPSPRAEATPTATPSSESPAARFRCVGNEPGWSIDIGPDSIAYVGEYGEVRMTYPAVAARTGDGLWYYETELDTPKGRSRLTITIAREPCSDGMSDRKYDHQVRLIHDFKAFYGCATRR